MQINWFCLLIITTKCILDAIEILGKSYISGDNWGEDSYRRLAGVVHFHVASPALKFNNFIKRSRKLT